MEWFVCEGVVLVVRRVYYVWKLAHHPPYAPLGVVWLHEVGNGGANGCWEGGRSEGWVIEEESCRLSGGTEESIVASLEHPMREVPHHWLGLDGEVSEHFI